MTGKPRVRGRLEAVAAAALLACGACERASSREAVAAPTRATEAAPGPVAARGRLRPKDGVLRVAGPSDFVSVVSRLRVEEGQRVNAGDVIAETDTLRMREAKIARLKARIVADEAVVTRTEAEQKNADTHFARVARLFADGLVPPSDRDAAKSQLEVAAARVGEARASLASTKAELETAVAERDLSLVRAPIDGQVLKIHARAGAKVGPEGILDLARTDAMYAVAEVYDSDVSRVKVGDRARVTSPALGAPLEGTVERIGLTVGRLQSPDPDPAAKADARIVEVEIRLENAAAAARFTDLEVHVVIGR